VTAVLYASLAALVGSGLLLIVAFVRAQRWLSRVVVVDAVSLVTACAVALLAAYRSDAFLLDAAILVAMVAVVGTVALLHFMPLPNGARR